MIDAAAKDDLHFCVSRAIRFVCDILKFSFDRQRGYAVNKNDLVRAVSDDAGLSRSSAEAAVDAVFDSISKTLVRGDEARLVGFGTFIVAKRKASEGRNPRTGEPIKIPASKVPKFRPGKALKDAVNRR
jgi:DNA-binding protein HU-beta